MERETSLIGTAIFAVYQRDAAFSGVRRRPRFRAVSRSQRSATAPAKASADTALGIATTLWRRASQLAPPPSANSPSAPRSLRSVAPLERSWVARFILWTCSVSWFYEPPVTCRGPQSQAFREWMARIPRQLMCNESLSLGHHRYPRRRRPRGFPLPR